jgi:hypothetical protein
MTQGAIGAGERARRGQDQASQQADVDAAYHDCFNTPAGRLVLEHLRKRYVEMPTEHGESESALREFMGQRNLVLEIQRRITRGER